MALRIALFVMMALGLLGFGTVAWISTRPPTPAELPQAAGNAEAAAATHATILVAAHQLRAGTFLKADDIKPQDFPTSQIPPGASPDTPAMRGALQGAMLRHTISDGQAVLNEDVLRTGDHGFLAAVLEPGMRAMTFSLTDVASDWALIWPGDRVDLILTQQFDAPDTYAPRRMAAETVISNIRVVAVDKQLMQGEMPDDAERKTLRTLTVEVTPEAAERLAIAMRLGRLTISLRAASPARDVAAATDQAADAGAAPAPIVTWGGDVAHALDQPTHPDTVVRVYRGAEDGKEFRF